MQVLIDIGFRQGAIIGFPDATTDKSSSFKEITPIIQNGRFGEAQIKGVSTNNLFVTLTQDCTISNDSKYIELAQLKTCKVKNEGRIESLLVGKDYNKLILKINDSYFEAEEILITKVKKQELFDFVNDGHIEIKGMLPNRTTKILLDWRLLNYLREPFPDKFNRLLSNYLRESGAWFTRFLLEYQNSIHSIRVYISPEDDENASQYQFSICAVLTKLGEEYLDHIERQIDRMLQEFGQHEAIYCLQNVDLDFNSITIPENLVLSLSSTLDDFTFANAYVMREFNFQYLCY